MKELEEKRCIQCEEMLPIEYFEPRGKLVITKTATIRKYYRRKKCNSCRKGRWVKTDHRNPNYINPEDRIIDSSNIISANSRRRINGYGLTIENFFKILEHQGNCCNICGYLFKEVSEMNIDHCHNSNLVRGILCWDCNTSIGKFKDDITILQKAIKYLENPPAYNIIKTKKKPLKEILPYTGTTLPIIYVAKKKPEKVKYYKPKPKEEYHLFNAKGQLVITYYGIPDVLKSLNISRYSFSDLMRGKQKKLKGVYTIIKGKLSII